MAKKAKSVKIREIEPRIILRGGLLKVSLSAAIPAWDLEEGYLFLGDSPLRILGAGPEEILCEAHYSSEEEQEELPLFLDAPDFYSRDKSVFVPVKISENHVFGASPVCDVHGNIYFIDLKELQNNKQSVIYQYQKEAGKAVPFLSGVSAPTSLTYFEGVLLFTSMLERKLYRCVAPGEAETFSQGLGSVFGLAVNSLGEIFAGDQTGSLFKIDATGKASFYAALPESFKGYHFAFSKEDELYISIPSSVGKNQIYRIGKDRKAEPFLETMNILGGIAFSGDNRMFWVENSREEGMVLTFDRNGKKKKVVSASFILGLVFSPEGDLIITDLHHLYRIKKEWIEV